MLGNSTDNHLTPVTTLPYTFHKAESKFHKAEENRSGVDAGSKGR
jgi:hypothetical protein